MRGVPGFLTQKYDHDPLCPYRHPWRALAFFLGFLALASIAMILGGCGTTPAKVEIREVPGPTQYVKIDPKFTDHPNLPPVTGKVPPIQAPKIAAERRTLLERCYIQLDQIKAIEGTKP